MKNLFQAALILLFVYSISISFIGINSPLGEGHHGFILGEKARPAIYWLRFGIIETKFGQLVNTEWELGKERYNYNVHHPIGLPLLLYLSFKFLGISEFSARLPIVFVNAFSLIFFYMLMKELFEKKVALLSLFFFVFSPMFFYMRNFVSTEVFSLLFIFAVLYFYIKYIKSDNKKHLLLCGFFFFFGTLLSDWWVYFTLPTIIFHRLIYFRKKDTLIFIPISILSFSLYLLHVYILTHSIIGENSYMGSLIDRLLFRLNLNAESQMYKIGFQSLVATIYENSRKYFTNSLFSIFFISLVLLKKIREKEIGFLFVSSLSFFLILFLFSNITWIHDFFVLFLVFPIAAFCSVFLNRINLHRKEKIILLLTLLAVFLLESYHSYIKIHQWFITSPPIVKFVAENKGNFLVTYYENPDYHQFRFYSDLRKTKMVRNKEEFLRELLNEDYNYIIVMPEGLEDKNFLLYLRENFRSVKVSNEYEIFYLK
jgi:4-amino-4-deoxy-L-arabinose transferase-like glycosyltransferase